MVDLAHVTHSGIDGLQWRELLLPGQLCHGCLAVNIDNDGQGVVGACSKVTRDITIHPTVGEIVS